MARRSREHIIDLGISDSASDTTPVVPQKLARKKRMAENPQDYEEEIVYEPQRKRARHTKRQAKTASGAKVKIPPPNVGNIDLSKSDSEAEQVTITCRCAQPRFSITSRSPTESEQEERPILRELSAQQFHNKLRGPIAWYQRPRYDNKFIAQFSRPQSPALSAAVGASRESERKAHLAEQQKRSRKVVNYSDQLFDDEFVEDQAKSTRSRTSSNHAPPRKQTRARREDESEFDTSSETASKTASSAFQSEHSDNDSRSLPSDGPSDDEAIQKPKRKAPVARGSGGAKKASRMVSLLTTTNGQAKGLDHRLPPLSSTPEIFDDITRKSLDLGLKQAIQHLGNRPIRVATLCSGTESPLLALEMICSSLSNASAGTLNVEHLFSAEIVPFKQAYIERNFQPQIIFRDITELTNAVTDDKPMGTTAYGSKVAIPKNVDLVIAGTSCVDFSLKNMHKKGIRDGGESGDTWTAVLAFCRAFKPAIVLLENVSLAPWDEMLADYERIGYETTGVKVDTKDYYLPQTRQRGYMVCFEKQKLNAAYIKSASLTWSTLMDKLKRPASAPATEFTLPSDTILRPQIRDDESLRKVEWSQCAMRAMQYRLEKGIGNERPITHWSESGSVLPLDYFQPDWFRGREERVLDFLDVAYMRKTLPNAGMYDPRYKARFLEVSQNIDRDEDNKPFGIVSCITPSGRMLISDMGREVAPEELLMLQGLPLQQISFTTETPANIRDLAGNAMSTTVIGCATISALVAGYKMIKRRAPTPRLAISRRLDLKAPENVALRNKVTEKLFISTRSSVDMAKILDVAGRAQRLCFCEGITGLTTKAIQTCTECGHTTCSGCGGNPRHHYRQIPTLLNLRTSTAVFEELVKSILPLQLKFAKTSKDLSGLSRLGETETYKLALSALGQIYSFQRIRRTHQWVVTYTAENGSSTLDFVIKAAEAQWRLFVHPPKHTPLNDPTRVLLRQPVAISNATNNFLANTWQLRVTDIKSALVKFIGSGSHVASMWSRRGMPDFRDHFMWEYLQIDIFDRAGVLANLLNGTYQYLPHCGTANECLYKRNSGDRPVFLFLDPSRLGSPDNDCFVFSYDVGKLEPGEIRPIIARLERPWLAWSTNNEPSIPAITQGRLTFDSWIDQKLSLCPEKTQLAMLLPRAAPLSISLRCSNPLVLCGCSIPLVEARANCLPQYLIKAQDVVFFEQHRWAFESMRQLLPGQNWTVLNVEHKSDCLVCSPNRPEVRWSLEDDGTVKPYEDTLTATSYERAVKTRPEPFYVQVETQSESITLGVVGNLSTLAHRAGARLPKEARSPSYLWRLSTSQQSRFLFQPFQLRPTTGIEPCTEPPMTVRLFPKQLLALSWMIAQERGVKVNVEDGEEAAIPSLGWRLEVCAQATVDIRGGICADHPGFGKTITSLALISSEFQDKERADLESECYASQRIPTAATLIVCPRPLVRQWVAEVQNKLQWQDDIYSVETLADLAKLSISNFQSAKIIVVSRALLGFDAYVDRLAAFAAIPGPATQKGRAFKQWLQSAMKEIPKHVDILQRNSLNALKIHVKRAYKEHLASDRFRKHEPSRRLRGASYVTGKAKKGSHSTPAPLDVDTSNLGMPLFEQFSFNRLIVDEFHEYTAREYEMITNLQARKRWGLSGTPAISDLCDVSEIASLLHVPLRKGDYSPATMVKRNVRKLKENCTAAEEFNEMRQVRSDAMHARMYENSQRFLDTCVRRNIMDFADIQYAEHLLPVSLDICHRALYQELFQNLNSADMRIKRMPDVNHRHQRINELFRSCNSSSAEEALSKHASFFEPSDNDTLEIRQQQLNTILLKLPTAVHESRKSEPERFEQWRSSRLDDGGLGDPEVIDKVRAAFHGKRSGIIHNNALVSDTESDMEAEERTKKKARGKQAQGKNARTAFLQDLCDGLVIATRSLRYMRNVELAKTTVKKKLPRTCDNPCCADKATDLAVSVACGHLLCRSCFADRAARFIVQCAVPGCLSAIHDEHLLWLEKFDTAQESAKQESYGKKIDVSLRLLSRIQKAKEQAILFVQFENQLGQMERALVDNGISCVIVTGTKDAGNKIENFRETAGTAKQKTVIVLNASDETAAGSNLQNANHVIFLSPLLRDTQYSYEASMAQAIGRLRRHGQKKKVHVYRIFALNTIDVDILEHRERRTNALTEEHAPCVQRPSTLEKLDAKPERTQLVRESGHFSLRPQSWLLCDRADGKDTGIAKNRVLGWEDFSSLVKFSRAFTEDDD